MECVGAGLVVVFQNAKRYMVGQFHRGNGAKNGPVRHRSNLADRASLGVNTSFDYTQVVDTLRQQEQSDEKK